MVSVQKDKVRDIARGVLPSTARKGARDNKRNFHKKHRSAQREANHGIERSLATISDHGTVVHDPDLFDDFEDRHVFDGYSPATKKEGLGWDDLGPNGEIIYDRRAADKLGPLIRWAEATEKRLMVGWSGDDKYAYFKAILPDTLQGRHALGHVETALRLDNDIFWRYYRRFTPTTFNEFRNALDRCLATKAGRKSLREFVRDIVPVAGHMVPTNLTHTVSEQARDENGDPIYVRQEVRQYDVVNKCYYTACRNVPKMVDVPVPTTVAVACDDCSFLRNDPLATPAAVARFADIVWNGRFRYNTVGRRMRYDDNPHSFVHEIMKHVLTF